MSFPIFKKLCWLFFINLFISAFTFGGGYVVIPMIRKNFVEKRHYLTEEQVVEMAAIAQSSPGAIAINLSALAGFKTAGLAGAIVSCVAAVLPALIILSVISMWYEAFSQSAAIAAILKGMEAGVAALIADLVINMYKSLLQERSLLLSALVPIVFIGNYFFNIHVAVLLLASCVICVLTALKRQSNLKIKGGK